MARLIGVTEDIASARLVRVCRAAQLARLAEPEPLRIAYDCARACRLLVEAHVDRTLVGAVLADLERALKGTDAWAVVFEAHAKFRRDILGERT